MSLPVSRKAKPLAAEICANSGGAYANLGIAVHSAKNSDGVGHSRLDGPHCQAHQGLGAGASAGAVHVKVGTDAQVVHDGGGGSRVSAVVAHHAVHVLGREPGVVHGVANGHRSQRPGGTPRAAAVLSLADTHDAVFAVQAAWHFYSSSTSFQKSALLTPFVVSLSNHPSAKGPFDKLMPNGRFQRLFAKLSTRAGSTWDLSRLRLAGNQQSSPEPTLPDSISA